MDSVLSQGGMDYAAQGEKAEAFARVGSGGRCSAADRRFRRCSAGTEPAAQVAISPDGHDRLVLAVLHVAGSRVAIRGLRLSDDVLRRSRRRRSLYEQLAVWMAVLPSL